jgi:Ca2+-binding RTX toxin-like protein
MLSGTPANADVGSYELRLKATDGAGASASTAFTLAVGNVNDAPAVLTSLEDQSFEAGAAFTFAVLPGTFVDPDAGDSLVLSAGLFGGAPLPSWLTFDPATFTFAGNAATSDIGISHVAVTATDAAGESVTASFGLIVRAVAGSTVVGTPDEDVIYGGTGDEKLTAQGSSDYVYGDIGNDLLRGGTGNDVLQGGAGDDVLRAGTGQNLLDGGAGDDLIFGGPGASFIAGGAGNDTIKVGAGSDVISFNRGDGWDTVIGGGDGGNTLSFGGGIRYSDLTFAKSGDDLVVGAGGDDDMVLRDWYRGSRSVLNLQFVLDATEDFDSGSVDPLYNRKVQTFDFLGLVSAFDQARLASPGLTSWQITNALLQYHLSAADDFALGGDLAYWYGKNRTLGGISLAAAQHVIGASGFGSDAQSLQPFSGLQDGFVKLS